MAITPFKVTQGHRFWYQSKAHIQLPTNNFIHYKSGRMNTKINKQTTKSCYTIKSYIYRNMTVNHISECVYKLSYQPNCTRLKISFSICLTEHLVIQI